MYHAYYLHVSMEQSLFFSNAELGDFDVFWDFADLPREIFYRVLRDQNTGSKIHKKDLMLFKEKLMALNGRTDVKI